MKFKEGAGLELKEMFLMQMTEITADAVEKFGVEILDLRIKLSYVVCELMVEKLNWLHHR